MLTPKDYFVTGDKPAARLNQQSLGAPPSRRHVELSVARGEPAGRQRSQDAGYSGWNTMALRGGRQNSAECCWLWQGTFSAVTPPRLPWLLPA